MVYTFNRFVWDPAKATSNLLKHGVDFRIATAAFDDPDAIYLEDTSHSTERETREHLIGMALGIIFVIVFTVRAPDETSRIISARLANRKERKKYEKAKSSKEKEFD